MAGSINAALEPLASLCNEGNGEIDLAEAALLLAALFQPEAKLDRYRHHIRKLCDETSAAHQKLVAAGAEDSLETRLAALKQTLSEKHGYAIETENAGHIQNADMMRTIDRGKGGNAVLGLLYIHTARAQEWRASALDIGGAIVGRLDSEGKRLLFDPSEKCRILQASDLRLLVKAAKGPHAELSAAYYEPLSGRALLIRLHNQVKLRQIEAHDYESAYLSVSAMRIIDPSEYRLLLDAGVLAARTGRKAPAIQALEAYIAAAPDPRDREEASLLLREVRLMRDPP